MTTDTNLKQPNDDLGKSVSNNDVIKTNLILQSLLREMASGVDLRALTGTILVASGLADIKIKKKCFTLLSYIFQKNQDDADISNMIVMLNNSLSKGASKSNDPLSRALSIRCACELELVSQNTITEFSSIILSALNDNNDFVCKQGIMSSVILHKIDSDQSQRYLIEILKNKLDSCKTNHSNLIVSILDSLAQIMGEERLDEVLTKKLFVYFIKQFCDNNYSSYTEWDITRILMLLLRYKPESYDERKNVFNILDKVLTNCSSSCILCAVTAVFLKYSKYTYPESADDEDQKLQKKTVSLIIPKYITSIYISSPEVAYTLLAHLLVFARRYPEQFYGVIEYFLVNYDDEDYVADMKFKILGCITNHKDHVKPVLDNCTSHLLLERPGTIKSGVQMIRELLLKAKPDDKLADCCDILIKSLISFFVMLRVTVINEIFVILPDLFRLFASTKLSLLKEFFNFEDMQTIIYMTGYTKYTEKALVNYIWCIGQYADVSCHEIVYFLEDIMKNHWKPNSYLFKRALLDAIFKLFLIIPRVSRNILQEYLKRISRSEEEEDENEEDSANINLQKRATILANILLLNNGELAKEFFFQNKNISCTEFCEDNNVIDTNDVLFDEINTLSIIYGQSIDLWSVKDKTKTPIEKCLGETVEYVVEDEQEEEFSFREGPEITLNDFDSILEVNCPTIDDGRDLGYMIDCEDLAEALKMNHSFIRILDFSKNHIKAYTYSSESPIIIHWFADQNNQGVYNYIVKSKSDGDNNMLLSFWLHYIDNSGDVEEEDV